MPLQCLKRIATHDELPSRHLAPLDLQRVQHLDPHVAQLPSARPAWARSMGVRPLSRMTPSSRWRRRVRNASPPSRLVSPVISAFSGNSAMFPAQSAARQSSIACGFRDGAEGVHQVEQLTQPVPVEIEFFRSP